MIDDLRTRAAATHGGVFSFRYGCAVSRDFLPRWQCAFPTPSDEPDAARRTRTWTDPATGLRVQAAQVAWRAFPALEWLLEFEHCGDRDTPLIHEVRPLDLTLTEPRVTGAPYRVHVTAGGPANETDFEASLVDLAAGRPLELSAGQGRSSHRHLPFFKIEHGRGSLVVAIGWSGNWQARLTAGEDGTLHLAAGLARTRFLLHPGERVRGPRILVLAWDGDADEAGAQFRQLIYRHYAARRAGRPPLPIAFCNTCFTRGGGWLNECNAENQISLIRALAPLGIEAVITDAGWFEGGWPDGAGNWTPRRDAYPDGMAPVAAAARHAGLVYGLWFEPERVVAGTTLHRLHPDWLLAAGPEPQQIYLADFARPAVRDYYFDIVAGFMQLPGFRVYRQDFNVDPLPYWQFTDAPDRQGVTEMTYIAGLYAFWDRLATAWPDALREECASGGNRIDLETVMRMHIHQKTDFWFHNEVDQASLWGLSQYLPNGVVVAHLNRLDDYSFHSTLASSLCVGWIADAPDFDAARGRALLTRYRAVRHLLVGAWYPLTPYSRDSARLLASQYHRPDLDEGMVLVFRRSACDDERIRIRLRGLARDGTYELHSERSGPAGRRDAAELATGFELHLPARPQSDLLTYRRVR